MKGGGDKCVYVCTSKSFKGLIVLSVDKTTFFLPFNFYL